MEARNGFLKSIPFMLIGILSDTHGLLRTSVLEALQECELIIHAGDIGRPEIIDSLSRIAPVLAVRGNVDHGQWASEFPLTQMIEAAGIYIYVVHDLHDLDLDPKAAGIRIVITGHSHRPAAFEDKGVLYLNPGSAGPLRFLLHATMALLRIESEVPQVRIIELQD